MNTSIKIQYAWLALGVVFGIVGLVGLLGGNFMSILTIAISALIIWSTLHNFGGWENFKYDFKARFPKLFLFNKKRKKPTVKGKFISAADRFKR